VQIRLRAGEPLARALAERFGASPAHGWLTIEPAEVSEPTESPEPARGWHQTFDGVVPLAGRSVRLRSAARSGGYRVEAEGIGAFEVLPGGGGIRQVAEAAAAEPAALEELALGPPLVLAFALRRSWCLHASGIRFAGADGAPRCALFLGESGAGKSTLAEAFSEGRIADDVVPVAVGPEGASIFPRFPQLKLGRGEPAGGSPEILPLAAVYLLAPPTGAGASIGPGPSIRRLAPAEAALALVRSTVASRLLSAEDLRRNVEDCGRIADRARVCSLGFERRRERLPEVVGAVRDDLRADLRVP